MKKCLLLKLLSVMTIFTAMSVLSACTDNTSVGIGEATDSDVESKIETVENTDRPETEQGVLEKDDTVIFNTDLISDYGLTFDELSKKYGKVTHYNSPSGGTYYKFENGYGYYCCGDVNRIVDWIYDEAVVNETGARENCYAVVSGDTSCYSIEDISVTDLFAEPFTVLTVEEFSKLPGITYVKTTESDFTPGEYSSTFKYDGFEKKETVLIIYHGGSENEITAEARAEIFTNNPYEE